LPTRKEARATAATHGWDRKQLVKASGQREDEEGAIGF
jgi:hypothetical protein